MYIHIIAWVRCILAFSILSAKPLIYVYYIRRHSCTYPSIHKYVLGCVKHDATRRVGGIYAPFAYSYNVRISLRFCHSYRVEILFVV